MPQIDPSGDAGLWQTGRSGGNFWGLHLKMLRQSRTRTTAWMIAFLGILATVSLPITTAARAPVASGQNAQTKAGASANPAGTALPNPKPQTEPPKTATSTLKSMMAFIDPAGGARDIVISLIAALIGLTVGAIAGPHVRRARADYTLHRRRQRLGEMKGRCFKYKDIDAEIFVYDFCLDGYGNEDLLLNVTKLERLSDRYNKEQDPWLKSNLQSLPDCIFEAEAEIAASQAGKIDKIIFDNFDLVAFDSVTPSRLDTNERQGLRITASEASYADHIAVTSLFHSFSPRKRAEFLDRFRHGSRYAGRLSAISASVITNDGKILFARRSSRLKSDPHLYTCGVNEGIRRSDYAHSAASSLPHVAICRGFEEEFGVALPHNVRDRVKVWSLVLSEQHFEWYFYGSIDLRGLGEVYSSDAIQEAMSHGRAKDKFENESITFIPFSLKEILQYVRERRSEFTEYGASLAIMTALYHRV